MPTDPLPAWDLATTVAGWCTLGAGLVTLAMTRWVAPQPGRRVLVCVRPVVTGAPTVLFHGFVPFWSFHHVRFGDAARAR